MNRFKTMQLFAMLMMMITFIVMAAMSEDENINESTMYQPIYDRLIIDTNSKKEKIPRGFDTEQGVFNIQFAGNKIHLFFTPRYNNNGLLITAGGVIISRRSPAGKTWQRSNSIMKVSQAVIGIYSDPDYRENCIRSWLDPEFLSSDWYLNQLR